LFPPLSALAKFILVFEELIFFVVCGCYGIYPAWFGTTDPVASYAAKLPPVTLDCDGFPRDFLFPIAAFFRSDM